MLYQPKAWLNWVLLDERLQIVPEGSGGIHVGSPDAIRTLAQTGITIPKNGYIYVYVSNETELWDVFFDDIRIAHRNGAILEETHYYPFGLTMQAISSKAANRLKNSFKYNGKEEQRVEFSDGSGLEWLDYGARMYDNQLGRWQVIDPMADQMRRHSPFNYAFDNPIRFIDPDGMSPDDWYKDEKGNLKWLNSSSEQVKINNTSYTRVGETLTGSVTTANNEQLGITLDKYGAIEFSDGQRFTGNAQLALGNGTTITTGPGYKLKNAFQESGEVISNFGDGIALIGYSSSLFTMGSSSILSAAGEGISVTGSIIKHTGNFMAEGFNLETVTDAMVDVVIEAAPAVFEVGIRNSGVDQVAKGLLKSQLGKISVLSGWGLGEIREAAKENKKDNK